MKGSTTWTGNEKPAITFIFMGISWNIRCIKMKIETLSTYISSSYDRFWKLQYTDETNDLNHLYIASLSKNHPGLLWKTEKALIPIALRSTKSMYIMHKLLSEKLNVTDWIFNTYLVKIKKYKYALVVIRRRCWAYFIFNPTPNRIFKSIIFTGFRNVVKLIDKNKWKEENCL